MNFLKRVCLFVFGLAGLLALVALVRPGVGPWTREATARRGVDEYYLVVECLTLVAAIGLVVCLLRSIFVRNRKVMVVSKVGSDLITVTRDALSSQAVHIIEDGGMFKAKGVGVSLRRRGRVRVSVRVQPARTADVVSSGQELHAALVEGLETVCGDNVDCVSIEFVRAAEYVAPEAEGAGTEGPPAYGDMPADEHGALPSEAAREVRPGREAAPASVDTFADARTADTDDAGITVPMAHYSADAGQPMEEE